MRRRLYFMLPSVMSARAMLDELLLARVEERYIHFLARDGSLLPDMPEVNFLQKTDLIPGMEIGMVAGAASGVLIGLLLLIFPPEGLQLSTLALLGAGVGGAMFGTWVSGMASAAIPSSRLQPFMPEIEAGKVLMILDLPLSQCAKIEDMVAERHPETRFGGMEAHVPAFP